MAAASPYKIVQLANGSYSVHSSVYRETFHPVIGPEAEAEALYVKQLKLADRFRKHAGEFVIWDVGLGAAANPIVILKALCELRGALRIVSFDKTVEPLRFALDHADQLSYLQGFERPLDDLLKRKRVQLQIGGVLVHWELWLDDFSSLLAAPTAQMLPKPHLILFDAYSPARNPEMWTQRLFSRLFQHLDAARPCVLPTYSRSTLLRVSLLLAGFFVGAGHATGEKEETTIAANVRHLISDPLDRKWLMRARRSSSAEPLSEPRYRQAPLTPESWEKLAAHPQFKATG